jgi:4a-hydroxytetrahydrobiopterin dehydratase
METLTTTEIRDAGLTDWRQLARGLYGRFRTGSYATGLAFVTAVSQVAEEMNHHPDVKLTYPRVELRLWSHDAAGLTQRDVDLARRISEIADGLGVGAEPDELSELELALDTAEPAKLAPFWAALLTGDPANTQGDDVIDPAGRVPLLWFQRTDPHETPKQRFHLDLWVPTDVARRRVEAALAAGGTVADDEPDTFTVLADPDGNRVCVCVVEGR